MSEVFSRFLLSTDDVVKKSNIVFPGFSKKSLSAFRSAMDKLGINKNSLDDLITDGFNFRNTAASLKNLIAQNKNVNVATKELNECKSNNINIALKNIISIYYN